MASLKIATLIFLPLLFPALIWSQTAVSDNSNEQSRDQQESKSKEASPAPDQAVQQQLQALMTNPLPLVPPGEIKNQQIKNDNDHSEYKQTDRMLWIVPNFAAVSANTELPPLTTWGKFVLATHDSLDYSGFTWTAILAGQEMAARADPEFGTGVKGYGRYYWRTFADGVSGSFFTEAIVPSITREDPRYFTLGHGGFFRRFGYAISRAVVTKTDRGGLSFNLSEVGGNALVAGLSNAYYPPQERGWRQTARDWGAQMESAVVNNIAKEFWPDIHHFLFGGE